jgi:hypothetical protein
MFRRRKGMKLLEAQHEQQATELRGMVQRLMTPEGDLPLDGFREVVEFVSSRGIDLDSMPDIVKEVRLGLAHGGVFLEPATTL